MGTNHTPRNTARNMGLMHSTPIAHTRSTVKPCIAQFIRFQTIVLKLVELGHVREVNLRAPRGTWHWYWSSDANGGSRTTFQRLRTKHNPFRRIRLLPPSTASRRHQPQRPGYLQEAGGASTTGATSRT